MRRNIPKFWPTDDPELPTTRMKQGFYDFRKHTPPNFNFYRFRKLAQHSRLMAAESLLHILTLKVIQNTREKM